MIFRDQHLKNSRITFLQLLVVVAILKTGIITASESVLKFRNAKSPKCKYSVRDVGFVNVHSFAWRLALVKPDGFDANEFAELDQNIRKQFGDTNVNYLWLEKDSQEWMSLEQKVNSTTSDKISLTGVLSNSNDEFFALLPPNANTEISPSSYDRTIRSLIESPFRQQVLAACSESLCTIVLIESGDASQNEAARKMLDAAVKRIEKQMWELEKPTEKAPVGLVLQTDNLPNESWFAKSLGVQTHANGTLKEPTFAIVYGQGRRLGELLLLSEASAEKLVGRAAVCGGDCECELDRDWLYGHQFVHRWTKEIQSKAELTLNFDPLAAYVKSEVAAIVRKTGRDTTKKNRVDLGPGLIIHDLEPIERKSSKNDANHESSKSTDSKKSDEQIQSDLKNRKPNSSEKKSPDIAAEDPPVDPRPGLPFSMIALLLLVALVVGVWTLTRSET